MTVFVDGDAGGGVGAPLRLRLDHVEDAGQGARLYRFVALASGGLPEASPGAHLVLHLPGGYERQYSILNPQPAPDAYEIAVRREADGRGGSRWMHDHLVPGDVISASSPVNAFQLVEQAAFSVLIGGGIGITPLIAMARRLQGVGRPFTFHAAFQSRAAMLLEAELAAIPSLALHLDDEAGGMLPVREIVRSAPRESHLYCCGPVAMIEAFIEAARADGRPDEAVHCEYFAPAAAPSPGPAGLVVELARSGLTLVVPPGQSILDAVREAGIAARASCEQGTCGACEVRVLEGVPEHFDAVLSPQDRRAGKVMMICCSGALTDRLVLDL